MQAVGIAGLGMGLAGAFMKGGAQAGAAEAGAQLAEVQGKSAVEQARFQERQYRREADLTSGKANAITAASGVALGYGSPLLMELDRAKQKEVEALNIRRTGKIIAGEKQYEADYLRRSKKYSLLGSFLEGGSILTSFVGKRA